MKSRAGVVALCLALAVAPTLGAQVGDRPAAGPVDRAAAEQRVRERITRLLKERVGLSDDQLRRLAEVSPAFEQRRRALFQDERTARQSLRRELAADAPNQASVSTQVDQLFALQRRRLDLAAEEQRSLATFMTPVQRARYLALQEQIRRRAEEMRRGRGGGRGGPRRGGPRDF